MYKFYLLLNVSIQKLPKLDRYSIGQKCLQKASEVLEDFYIANSHKDKDARLQTLKSVDLKNKLLKVHIRMLYDTKALDQKKYILLENGLQEIGRMLGGWINQTIEEIKKMGQENPTKINGG